MITVKFEINPEKEYEYHQLFCKTHGFEGMSIFSLIPIDNKTRILNKINKFWDDNDRKLIKKIESEWKLIEKDYFKLFENITETPCYTKHTTLIFWLLVRLSVSVIHLILGVKK